MTADVQGVLALAAVAAAALYAARRAWSAWRAARRIGAADRAEGCGSGCDCH
jgi:hypothetical protein